ncbi:MAG: sugar transferase [Candidatus Humimicrobiaceae bacterium]
MANLFKNTRNSWRKIIYGLFLFLNDVIILAFSCFFSYYLRFFTKIFKTVELSYKIDLTYVYFSLYFIVAAISVLLFLRLYDIQRIYSKPTYYLKLIISVIISVIVLIIIWLIFADFYFSRIWILLLFIITTVLLISSRSIIAVFTRNYFIKTGQKTDNMYFGIGENLKIIKSFSRLRKKIIYGFFLVFSDLIFLILSFYYSYYLRFFSKVIAGNKFAFSVDANYTFYAVIFILSAILIFFLNKLYNWDNIYRGSGYMARIIRAIFINIIIIILVGSVLNRFTFSRLWLVFLTGFCLLTIIGSRLIIELVTQMIIRKLGISSKTVIVGIGENGKRIEDTFSRRSFWGYPIMGYIDKRGRIEKHKSYASNFKILGYAEKIKDVVIDNNIQRVIISGLEFKYNETLEIIEQLKGLDVSIMIFPGFFEFSIKRMAIREISGIPLMQVANIGFFGINLFLKNLLDYFLGSIIFIFFIPIYLIVGLMIKFDSPGPVFYKQKRYTRKCKEFYIYKFRTMFANADKRLSELEEFNEADGPLFKMKNDPRVTRTGRFLRKFSIDELPQIINVLRGELSLVGPRPPIPSEVTEYTEWEMKCLDVKQGITGLWQISGRSELNFEEMTRLDLYYIQNWSIMMDIMIILKTLPAVLFSKGAY